MNRIQNSLLKILIQIVKWEWIKEIHTQRKINRIVKYHYNNNKLLMYNYRLK